MFFSWLARLQESGDAQANKIKAFVEGLENLITREEAKILVDEFKALPWSKMSPVQNQGLVAVFQVVSCIALQAPTTSVKKVGHSLQIKLCVRHRHHLNQLTRKREIPYCSSFFCFCL